MAGTVEGLTGKRLLRERAARRDGCRPTGQVRRLFRNHRGTGLLFSGCGRQLGTDRARPPGGIISRGADIAMIRVVLPPHLRTLSRAGTEVQLEIVGPVTQRSVLDALEARYPMLRGTIRDHVSLQRRPFLRFFACAEDYSHESPDAPLPAAVASGTEPFMIVGAIAGG